jgi:hypothetical protein
LIILLLVFFPPAGIVLAWLSSWSRKTKIAASVASLVWFIIILALPGQDSGDKTDAKPVTATTTPAATPSKSPTASPTPSPTTEPPTTRPTTAAPAVVARPEDKAWTTCKEAWAAGVSDDGMRRSSDRGYRAALDGNGDGIACSKSIPEESADDSDADSDSDAPSDTGSDDSGSDPTTDPPDDSGSVYYANCSEVRAAGAAPIHAGEPGYSRHLDRDGDGVACE